MNLGYRGNVHQGSNSGQRTRWRACAVAMLLVVACSSCEAGPSRPAHAPPGGPTPTSSQSPTGSVPADSAACESRPGRSVTELPDIHVAPVHVPAVVADDGSTVLRAVTVPAQTVDAGCVIRFAAPG